MLGPLPLDGEDNTKCVERQLASCSSVSRYDIMTPEIPLSSKADFIEIEHTADWAIRVRGKTLQELFVNAAAGMYSLMADLSSAAPTLERAIQVSGVDAEALLVNWLNELVYHTEVNGEVFSEFRIDSFEPTRLHAMALGGRGIQLKKQIKAVTFHNLRIEATGQGNEVTIVFDV